uniref:(northern house mosquito) hypothetical protein n=1 Tax=Culex pipiens TaxID=7175 RepID=A0A8D8AHQ8_CULPI
MLAPYARSDASQYPCNSTSTGSLAHATHRGMDIDGMSSRLLRYSHQYCCCSGFNGASHDLFSSQRDWTNILARTITGPSRPSGRNSLARSDATTRRVMTDCVDQIGTA